MRGAHQKSSTSTCATELPSAAISLSFVLRPSSLGRFSQPAGDAVVPAVPAPIAIADLPSSLAALIAGHILHDGEVVQLILKPSLLFIVLSSLNFAGIVGVITGLAILFDQQVMGVWPRKLELAIA